VLSLSGLRFGIGNGPRFTEQEVVNADAEIIREFRRDCRSKGFRRAVLNHARGLAIIKVLKVGFGVSGKGGEGVVVRQDEARLVGPILHRHRRGRRWISDRERK
jgi:hypothetical protein